MLELFLRQPHWFKKKKETFDRCSTPVILHISDQNHSLLLKFLKSEQPDQTPTWNRRYLCVTTVAKYVFISTF